MRQIVMMRLEVREGLRKMIQGFGVGEGARNERAVSLCEVPESYEKEDGGTRSVTKVSIVLKDKKCG